MLKDIGIGLGVVVAGLILFSLTGSWNTAVAVSGTTAAISLGLAAVLSGSLGSGDRVRANYATEDNTDRKRRRGLSSKLFLIGIPNLIAVVIYVT